MAVQYLATEGHLHMPMEQTFTEASAVMRWAHPNAGYRAALSELGHVSG
jgi:hypothetical protein